MTRYALTEVIEKLLDRPINERSQNFQTTCPFHAERRASMSIDLERGLFICFACGEKGGLRKLSQLVGQRIDEGTIALAGVDIDRYEEPPDFSEKAMQLYASAYRHKPKVMIEYLHSRNLENDTLPHFTLGWDDNRKVISMPYYDEDRVVAIRYRDAYGNKSYETGSKPGIYNINDVGGKNAIILCEGESDTHAAWSELRRLNRHEEIGVGGISGAHHSQGQVELWYLSLLWAERVYMAFDADEAGDKGVKVFMNVLGEKAVRMRPTRGKDLTEHLMRGGTLFELGLDG